MAFMGLSPCTLFDQFSSPICYPPILQSILSILNESVQLCLQQYEYNLMVDFQGPVECLYALIIQIESVI